MESGWFRVDNAVYDKMLRQIGPAAFVVYCGLSRYSKRGSCDPTIETICEATGLSRSTVHRAIRTLESASLIAVTRTRDQAGYKHSSYQILDRVHVSNEIHGHVSNEIHGHVSKTSKAMCQMEAIENKTVITKTRESARIPPDVEDVRAYVTARNLGPLDVVDAFMDHFDSNGWRVGGRTPMKDWQAAVRGWFRRENQFRRNGQPSTRQTGPRVPTDEELANWNPYGHD